MSDLISRQALCDYALNQKDESVTPNDIMRFPSARGNIDDLYFLLDTNANVLDAIYLTKDQAIAIEHVLDIVEQCGNEFTLVSAVEGGNIPDFRPKKGEC